MKTFTRASFSGVAILILSLTANIAAQKRTGIEDRFAVVNGVRLHYLVAGKGEPVLLLHGYAENSHMWRPLIVELAKSHTIIAPDLRGFGGSAKPSGGYLKRTRGPDPHGPSLSPRALH